MLVINDDDDDDGGGGGGELQLTKIICFFLFCFFQPTAREEQLTNLF